MNSKVIAHVVIQSIFVGILWGLTFYFIRKRLNYRNFQEDAEKTKEMFWWDGIYGGLAAAVAFSFKALVLGFVDPYFE